MLEQDLKDKLAQIAVKQIDAGVKIKKSRLESIKANEDLYAGKTEPGLPGEYRITLPIMDGFVDTLLSEENQPVKINYEKQEEADYKIARKVTAAWEFESAPTRGAWNIKDLDEKKLAALSGRGIAAIYSESSPKYRNIYRVVHYANFYVDPMGGADLELASFKGELNCFKTKADLDLGVKEGRYDPVMVSKLVATTKDKQFKKNQEAWDAFTNSMKALGMNPEGLDFEGEPMYGLAEHYMLHDGKMYYLLIDPVTAVAVRVSPIEELFESGIDPYVSWATHRDPANFWSKAPADTVRPIAINLSDVFSQSMGQLFQRLRGKRLVDPAYVANWSALEDFTTRFVEATVPSGKQISDGVFEFQTPDNTSITLNLTRFLNSFLGEKTGITPGAQGQAVEDKVGIYFGNIQQVARRMNLYSAYYKQAYAQKGLRYFKGLQEHLKGDMPVKLLGAAGYEWDILTREEVTSFYKDPNVLITGGADEEQLNVERNKNKSQAIANALTSPAVASRYNPDWLAEENLRIAGYEEGDIRRAMDKDTYGDRELLSEAAQAIEEIIEGDEPSVKLNRAANTAFIQKIIDFAYDNEMEQEVFDKLMEYAERHYPVALENAVRKARLVAMTRGMMGAAAAPGSPAAENVPAMPGAGGASPMPGEGLPARVSTGAGAPSIVK